MPEKKLNLSWEKDSTKESTKEKKESPKEKREKVEQKFNSICAKIYSYSGGRREIQYSTESEEWEPINVRLYVSNESPHIGISITDKDGETISKYEIYREYEIHKNMLKKGWYDYKLLNEYRVSSKGRRNWKWYDIPEDMYHLSAEEVMTSLDNFEKRLSQYRKEQFKRAQNRAMNESDQADANLDDALNKLA